MVKICTICNKEKDISQFHKRGDSKNLYRSNCKECYRLSESLYRKKHREEIRKNYRLGYKLKYNKNIKNYYIKNKEKINIKRKEYFCKRRKSDINFKLRTNIARRILHALHDNYKSNHTLNLLGCSINYLKQHLQTTAIKNGYKEFDINHYSSKKYHIDHIVPCAVFNLSCSYHQKLCFNWSNLQILKAEENLIKGDKNDFY
jgi:hypothetical protein